MDEKGIIRIVEHEPPGFEERKRTMKRSGRVFLAAVLGLGLGVLPLHAQRGGGQRGLGQGPHTGQSVDVLLEMQEELELSSEQLGQIQELKSILDGEVTPLAENIRTLRRQIRDGEVDRDEGHRQLLALHGELMTASAPVQGRVQEILTVQQHRQLQVAVQKGRPGQGRGRIFQGRPGLGRVGAAQGRGAGLARRGAVDGSRGGFGPRQGSFGQGRAPALGFRRGAPMHPFAGQRAKVRAFRRGGIEIPPTPGGNLSIS